MNAIEKSNLTDAPAAPQPGKMSKRKSKNRKQNQQNHHQIDGKLAINGDSCLNDLGEKLDECLHIRENGSSSEHQNHLDRCNYDEARGHDAKNNGERSMTSAEELEPLLPQPKNRHNPPGSKNSPHVASFKQKGPHKTDASDSCSKNHHLDQEGSQNCVTNGKADHGELIKSPPQVKRKAKGGKSVAASEEIVSQSVTANSKSKKSTKSSASMSNVNSNAIINSTKRESESIAASQGSQKQTEMSPMCDKLQQRQPNENISVSCNQGNSSNVAEDQQTEPNTDNSRRDIYSSSTSGNNKSPVANSDSTLKTTTSSSSKILSEQPNNKNISCTVDASNSNSIDSVEEAGMRVAVLERGEENLTNILSCPQNDCRGNMEKDSSANVQKVDKIEGDGGNDANQGVKNDGGTIAIDRSSLECNIDKKISEQSTEIAANVVLDPTNTVIEYKEYESELQMQDIMRLIQTELSEPYSIYTYRYFIYNWPKLCFLAAHGDEYVGAIVCKLDMHMNVKRGYIAMLAVKKEYRKMKIGTNLVEKAIEAMRSDGADEVVLETEMKNIPALRLYENLGFVRDKRLFRYYLNGVDALRLKLWFR